MPANRYSYYWCRQNIRIIVDKIFLQKFTGTGEGHATFVYPPKFTRTISQYN